jgi:hypothetical protein
LPEQLRPVYHGDHGPRAVKELVRSLVVLLQFGKFARIHAIILIAFFQQSISPRIANYQFADVGLQQVVQPGRPGSFLEGDVHLSTQPINKLQDYAGFGLDDTFHHLTGRIPDRDRDAFLMYVHTDILTAAGHNRVCSFQDGLSDNQTLHQKGPPFYNAFNRPQPASTELRTRRRSGRIGSILFLTLEAFVND